MHRKTGTRAVAALGSVALVMSLAGLAYGSRFSPWRTPTNAEAVAGTSSELNTPYLDGCPILSPDGLSLYMASDRPNGVGGLDIWVARRASRNAPFGAPVNVGAPVNSPSDDFCPSPMADNWFLFVSTRPGGCGDADIYVSRAVGEHGWWKPLHLGCGVNSAAQEASPYLLADKKSGRSLLDFSSNRPGGYAPDTGTPDADVYVSPLTPLGFGPAQLVPGLNTAANDARPNLRPDGLEIVFDSNRAGTLGGADLYSAERSNLGDHWSTPVNLGAINSPSNESRGSLSSDGTTIYFGSNRPGSEPGSTGAASNDIYFSRRQRASNAKS